MANTMIVNRRGPGFRARDVLHGLAEFFEILRAIARITSAVELRRPPAKADLALLGIDPSAFNFYGSKAS
jgi:hypothetical protein